MSFLPLYKEEALQDLKRRPPDAHAGLWYDKFYNEWNNTKNGKYNWIQTVTGKTGNKDLIEEWVKRTTNLISARSGKLLFVKTASRFVTGIGKPHPVENGFTWHPLLGTAYLPGSSVKGLLRSWVTEWLDVDQEDAIRIFGRDKDKDVNGVGSVIFFDALPMKPVTLETDIMTPHLTKYYQNPKQIKPVDWYNPIPIPFLTVAKDQSFLFGIAPRRFDEQSVEDTRKVTEWLVEALSWMGAGAKTAVGYGRFEVDNAEQTAWEKAVQAQKQQQVAEKLRLEQEKQRQAELAKLSPIQREMHEDGFDDMEQFMRFINEKWLTRMDSPDTPREDQLEIAQSLADWYQTKKPDQWKKPNKKNQDKIKRIRTILDK